MSDVEKWEKQRKDICDFVEHEQSQAESGKTKAESVISCLECRLEAKDNSAYFTSSEERTKREGVVEQLEKDLYAESHKAHDLEDTLKKMYKKRQDSFVRILTDVNRRGLEISDAELQIGDWE